MISHDDSRHRRGLDWAARPTRFAFFTGKGGVGKTTIAAAAAIRQADAGSRVLLVSTDPASNLADVLAAPAGREHPAAVAAVPGLDVLDVDPQVAADRYRERVLAPFRGVAAAEELSRFAEQLAGGCTVEVAAFDTFARLLTDTAVRDRYDQVIFDTAPTGHTLRLLSLPAAWSGYLAEAPDGASCLGPLADLDTQRATYEAAVAALAEPALTTVTLVARADRGSLAEAARASGELAALGITRQQLVVNAVLADPLPGDAVAQACATAQRRALAALPARLAGLPQAVVPLAGTDLTGIADLRALTRPAGAPNPAPAAPPLPPLPGMDDLAEVIAVGEAHAILITGKGGVGKTTIAARLALTLAERGLPVHLSTTDPAGPLLQLAGAPGCLTASRVDPQAETARYVTARLASARGLDPQQRALLEEELRSPCTTELAVFRAFSGLLMRARKQFVIIDTAPTGHTLLLLDLTGAYHRQAMRDLAGHAGRVTTPLMRLQNPALSRLLIVTLPETTPVAEAAALQADLRRAGIQPFGWVINASLSGSGTRDPLLARRAALELPHLRRITSGLADRAWLAPWDPRYSGQAFALSTAAPSAEGAS